MTFSFLFGSDNDRDDKNTGDYQALNDGGPGQREWKPPAEYRSKRESFLNSLKVYKENNERHEKEIEWRKTNIGHFVEIIAGTAKEFTVLHAARLSLEDRSTDAECMKLNLEENEDMAAFATEMARLNEIIASSTVELIQIAMEIEQMEAVHTKNIKALLKRKLEVRGYETHIAQNGIYTRRTQKQLDALNLEYAS